MNTFVLDIVGGLSSRGLHNCDPNDWILFPPGLRLANKSNMFSGAWLGEFSKRRI